MKKAFTLVEIMIVIAIIGLLAVLGLPAILNSIQKARQSAEARNITDVNKAKSQLTLPAGSMGGQDYTNGQPVAQNDPNLLGLLHIASVSNLTLGSRIMIFKPIGTSAEYSD